MGSIAVLNTSVYNKLSWNYHGTLLLQMVLRREIVRFCGLGKPKRAFGQTRQTIF